MTLPGRPTRRTIVAAAAALALAGCVASPPQAAPFKKGPAVTLRLAVYGDSGYQQAGLLRGCDRLHPGTRIVVDATASQGSYSAALLRALAGHSSLDDLVAIPFTMMTQVIARHADRLVPLDTLGSAASAGHHLPGHRGTVDVAGRHAAADHLSARLVPLTKAWSTGVLRWTFATAVCPAWMLSLIAHVSGPAGSGAWSVIPVPGRGHRPGRPGGAGNRR